MNHMPGFVVDESNNILKNSSQSAQRKKNAINAGSAGGAALSKVAMSGVVKGYNVPFICLLAAAGQWFCW